MTNRFLKVMCAIGIGLSTLATTTSISQASAAATRFPFQSALSKPVLPAPKWAPAAHDSTLGGSVRHGATAPASGIPGEKVHSAPRGPIKIGHGQFAQATKLVGQLVIPGTRIRLGIMSVDVTYNPFGHIMGAAGHAPATPAPGFFEFSMDVAAERYWQRFLAAETGSKPIGQAQISLYAKPGEKTGVQYVLKSPTVSLNQSDSYANDDSLTLDAHNVHSTFSGPGPNLPETIVGDTKLTLGGGASDRAVIANFDDSSSGTGRAISFDIRPTQARQAYFGTSVTNTRLMVWTKSDRSQWLQYSIPAVTVTMHQLDQGQGLIDRLTVSTNQWTLGLGGSVSAPVKFARAKTQPVGSISLGAGEVAPVYRGQFNFNPFQPAAQQNSFYVSMAPGKVGLDLIKPGISHADLTLFDRQGGHALETFSVGTPTTTYSIEIDAYGTSESLFISSPTVVVSQVGSVTDNPKSPAGAFAVGAGAPHAISNADIELFSGSTTRPQIELPAGVITQTLLAGPLPNSTLTLTDKKLDPSGPVATYSFTDTKLSLYQYFPSDTAPLLEHVNLEPASTTRTYSTTVGAHSEPPLGKITMHLPSGDVSANLEAVSAGTIDTLAYSGMTLAAGRLTTQLFSGKFDATLVMYNKPGGKKLAQYQITQAFAEGEEFDYHGRATDQISFYPQSQTVTFTGRTGATASPVIGSFAFPGQQGTSLNSFQVSPGSVTQHVLSVGAYIYFPTGPFDAKIFQAAEAGTPISPVSVSLTKPGPFKGNLNQFKVFEFSESATSDGVQSFLSVSATAGG